MSVQDQARCQETPYRYKARLVANIYNQQEGIDLKETFSLMSTKDFLRIIMAIMTHFDLELHQMDVRTTFLKWRIS